MKPKYVNSLTNTNRILNLLQDQVKCDHDIKPNKSELDLEGVMFTPCPAAGSKADVKSEISLSCPSPCRQWADQVRTPHCLLPQPYTQWWETSRDICGHKLTSAWWRGAEQSWRPGATPWGPARGRRQVGYLGWFVCPGFLTQMTLVHTLLENFSECLQEACLKKLIEKQTNPSKCKQI